MMRTTALLALLALPFIALAEDLVTGDWTYKMESPMGEVKAAMALKVESGKLTGKLTFDGNRVLEISEGAVEGDTLKFTVKRNRQDGGTLTYKMAGKVDGKTIKGTATAVEMSDAGEMTWSATRD